MMRSIDRRLCLVLLTSALLSGHTLADPRPAVPWVTVHGTVFDYAGRAVEKARVSFSGQRQPLETDIKGHFTTKAPARAFVSASKHDMLGHVVLSDAAEQTVTIRMAQMPM